MRVLVIAPHADDETLGAGGTILRHIAGGDEVFWCLVTHAFADASDSFTMERLAIIDEVHRAYGFAGRFLLGLPAAGLDGIPCKKVIDALASVVREVKPELVYSVSGSDVNTDHDVVYHCAMGAVKPSYSLSIREIMLYETPSSTNWAFPEKSGRFQPNVFVDIDRTLDTKLAILDLYKPEVKGYPHPRSIEAVKALAVYRGSSVNVAHAEAFMQVRRVIR